MGGRDTSLFLPCPTSAAGCVQAPMSEGRMRPKLFRMRVRSCFPASLAGCVLSVSLVKRQTPQTVQPPLKSRLRIELELENLVYGTLISISKAEFGTHLSLSSLSPFGIPVIYKIGPLTEHISGYGQNVWNRTLTNMEGVDTVHGRLWFVYMSRLCSVHVLLSTYMFCLCSVCFLQFFGPPGEPKE